MMNSSIIRAALANLESELERARGAKGQIEAQHTRERISGGVYEYPEEALTEFLNNTYELLLVVLEASELSETRSRLIDKWTRLEEDGGVGTTRYDSRFDYLDCKAFEYISRLLNSLRTVSGEALATSDSYELTKLETILRKTPVLVHNRGITPSGEIDVQKVMHDYLQAYFTEYKHPITISGIIKDFKPDGGIRNLKAAIEFKYAATRDEVARSLSGIFEDASGYSGSLDWTRFYSLIYQTEPFESEDRFKSEMTRAGLITWKALLVTGPGSRTKS